MPASAERFSANFDDDVASPVVGGLAFISDVKERSASDAKTPCPPFLPNASTGFPTHRKRRRVSAFKQRRGVVKGVSDQPGVQSVEEKDRRDIDDENRKRLAAMRPADIEAERRELFASLNPAFIEKLLARASIGDGSDERSLSPTIESLQENVTPPRTSEAAKKVTFEMQVRDTQPRAAAPAIHFPLPLQPPKLDPNDPNFLHHLHKNYFPDLAADPQSLSWAAPLPQPGSEADKRSPYHPSLRSLAAKDIRFGFNGAIIPPKMARDIPVIAGLHHHGQAPEAAGYTIPELALLARSKVPAQRCISFQTLGRILFRLGRGEFGVEGTIDVEGPDVLQARHSDRLESQNESDVALLARSLWDCVEENRVLDTLSEEANKSGGHLSAKTLAQEALWLWRKGGGTTKRAV